MLTVVASYRQNVHAYPSGGGDYEVATVNLGQKAGVTVGAALLVDYVLTVAVSISSGVQNAASAIPAFSGHEALVASVLVVVLMAMNLRGVRESGTLFAIPTYGFMLGIIGHGALRPAARPRPATCRRSRARTSRSRPQPGYEDELTTIGLIVLLARAFSSGCAALTGVEAISNGVPAFRKPKSRNAATTLLLLGTIAVTMLLSIIVLARNMGLRYVDPQRHRPAAHRRRRAAARGLRPAHGHRPAVEGDLQRLPAGLLLRGRDDRDHPGAGREHGVQRLPGARLDPRPRRLRAPRAGLAR